MRSASMDAAIDHLRHISHAHCRVTPPLVDIDPPPQSNHEVLTTSIRKQKRINNLISGLNTELDGELQELMEQRIALEIQLYHLQPYPY